MKTIGKAIDVNVPVRTAYNQWTQFETFPQFMEGVEEVRQLSDKMLHWKAKIGPKTEEWDAEITEQEPDQRIAWRSISGAPNSGVVTFHYINDTTTRVTAQIGYEPDSMAESIGDKLGFMDRRVENSMKKFKEFIEKRGVATGAWRGEIDDAQVERDDNLPI